MHFVVTCDDEASVDAANSMMYVEGRRAAVMCFWEVRGSNIITCAKKQRNVVAANTVTVTTVPHMVSQEPVFLARRRRQRSVASRSLTSSLNFGLVGVIPDILYIMPVFPKLQKETSSGKCSPYFEITNQISACT